MPIITLYKGSVGLNTVLDPKNINSNAEEGLIEFSQAVNISIDDRGLVSLRNGDVLITSGDFHSLFCNEGDCFVIKEDTTSATLNKINSDLSLSVVRAGLSKGLRCEFSQTNTDTFYSNGVQNGFIRNGVNYAWPVNQYRGPDSDIEFATSVQAANHIAFAQGGTCIISSGQAIFTNHEAFKYGLFAPALGFIGFETDVIMICATKLGFYASDSKRTSFFQKLDGGRYNYKQIKVDSAPAIEWSLANEEILLSDIGINSSGFGYVWASQEGICLGTEDGIVINLTKEKVKYPVGYARGSCLIKGTSVIHTVW